MDSLMGVLRGAAEVVIVDGLLRMVVKDRSGETMPLTIHPEFFSAPTDPTPRISLDIELKLGTCSCCNRSAETVCDVNITYNLAQMWRAAGLPFSDENIEGMTGKDMAEALEEGLALLLADPDRYKAFNPSNGWGTYEGLCGNVKRLLDACKQYPTATISCSR